MAEKIVGAAVVLLCLSFGGFLVLASFFALVDGDEGEYLYAFGALGVALVVGGFGLMWRLAHRRPAKRPADRDDTDEGW